MRQRQLVRIDTLAPVMPDNAAGATDRLRQWAHQAAGALSDNTMRALRADSAIWSAWCAEQGAAAVPAEANTVAGFIDSVAVQRAPTTVRRYVASIAALHRAAGVTDVTKSEPVRLALKRMGRTAAAEGRARQQQARGLTETDVAAILATAGDSPSELRDVALLLVMRDALLRRGEAVALDVADIEAATDGSGTVIVRRSKTDTEGEGAVLWLAPRTMAAITSWRAVAGIVDGAVFRSVNRAGCPGARLPASRVPVILKRLAERARIAPNLISGHSPRVGMAQDLTAAGAELPAIMQAGRWKSATMPARYGAKLSVSRGAVAQFYGARRTG